MELKHDWKTFNSVLFPQDQFVVGVDRAHQKLVLLEEGQQIVDGIVSNGAYFSDVGIDSKEMNKDRLDSFASKYGVDQTIIIGRKDLDQVITDSVELGNNYFQQLELIRGKTQEFFSGKAPASKKRAELMVSRRHFVIELFAGSLSKFLPRSFNLLIFIDTTGSGEPFQSQSLLLSFSQGRIDQFFEPDYSSLHENRLEQWGQSGDIIGEYLESRYILPCYGLFFLQEQWNQMLAAAAKNQNPWTLFTKYCDEGSASVYPQSTLIKSLLASQRLLGYFGRF